VFRSKFVSYSSLTSLPELGRFASRKGFLNLARSNDHFNPRAAQNPRPARPRCRRFSNGLVKSDFEPIAEANKVWPPLLITPMLAQRYRG
jgi:hypothetical protein